LFKTIVSNVEESRASSGAVYKMLSKAHVKDVVGLPISKGKRRAAAEDEDSLDDMLEYVGDAFKFATANKRRRQSGAGSGAGEEGVGGGGVVSAESIVNLADTDSENEGAPGGGGSDNESGGA
jgi:hypothetical protein